MKRVPRPKPPISSGALLAGGLALLPFAAAAQSPLASSYATRDGRILSYVLGCASGDGSFTALPCGTAGYPVHVTLDGGAAGGGGATTAPGAASTQLTGVQGGGSGALPVAVSPSGPWPVTVGNFPATQPVSAATLPLPAGAAQDGTDAAGTTQLPGGAGIRGWLSYQVNLLGGINGSTNALQAAQAAAGLRVLLQPGGATQPVSAASLPLPMGAATAANQALLNADGGSQVHIVNLPPTLAVAGSVAVTNLPATQAVSATALPLPAGAATAANQALLNADGGSQAHVMNFPATQAVTGSVAVSNLPATQPVSATALPLPVGAATAAAQAVLNADGGSQVHVVNLPGTQVVAGTVAVGGLPQAARSGAWTDASFTATATAGVPAALAAAAARTGLHVWNLGAATACLNYTAAAAATGSFCAAGSVPIPAGGAYFEDQPANVSPEAISLVCAGTTCPLTIKVR